MRRVTVAAPALISALVAAGAAAGSGGTSIVIGPTCYNATDGPYTSVVSVRHKG
jgi:hypothetical protein